MKFVLLLCLAILSASITCDEPKTAYTIVRTYKSNSAEENIEIWEGASNTGVRVLFETGVSHENSVVNYEVCLSPAVHTFVCTDGDNNGWANGSNFVLKNSEGIVILQGTLDRYTRAEWSFDATLSISSSTSWKYSSTYQANWKETSFSDNSWSVYKAGSFPAPSSLTRYFRATINVPSSRASYALYEVGAYTKEGVIIYINGEEVFRRNLPTSTVSATTAATAEDSSLAYRRTTGPLTTSTMSSSTVVVAIEIHGMTTPTSETFKGYFTFIYGPCSKRTQDGTIASNFANTGSSTENMYMAFDDDIQTLWYYSGLPAHIDYTFNEGRTEWINAYELTAGWQWRERMPRKWKVYGINGDEQVLLDYRANYYFPNRRYTQRFYMKTNTQRFNKYRFEIEAVNANYDGELAEFELVACNEPIETPNLSYPQTTYEILRNLEEVRILPVQNGFTDFTITPTLPDGLSFNVQGGTIKGIPTSLMTPTIFTITGKHYSMTTSQSTTITISSYDCTAPKIRADIFRRTANNGVDSWEYVNIKNAQGVMVYEYESIASDYSDTNDLKLYKCLDQGVYTVNAQAATMSGWAESSYIAIDLFGRGSAYCVSRFSLYRKQFDSFQVNLAYETETSFKALLSMTAIPDNWYSPSFSDASWTTYSASQALQATSPIWLFRQTFTVSSQPLGQGFEYRILVRAGTLVYLDGVEINRILVPEGPITMNTRATGGLSSSTNSPEWRVITGLMSKVQPGTHLFATMTIHKSDYATRSVDFDGSLLIMTDSNRNPRNVDMYGSQSSIRWSGSDAAKLADQSYSTRWASWVELDNYSDQWAQITYNKWRTELVNKYCIVNAWDAPQQDPKKWTLYGSNDEGSTLTAIDTQENVVFTERTQKLCFYVPQNTNTYRSYRIVFQETRVPFPECQSVVVTELEFYLVNYDSVTVQPLRYPASTISAYVNTDFPDAYPESDYYHGYSVQPALPTGLSIMSGTGHIYGIPVAPSSGVYTVSAINPSGQTMSTQLTITVSDCALPKNLIRVRITGVEGDGLQNSYTLATLNGQTVASLSPFPRWAGEIVNNYCVDATEYVFTINDSGNNGWDKGRLVITNYNGEEILKTSLQYGESPKIFYLNLGYLVAPTTSTAKYTTAGASTPSTWTQINFNDNSWSQGTPGSFNNLNSVTTLYRIPFTLTNLQDYVVYEIMTLIRDGAIVYLNGVEINRINLPTSTTFTTPALKQFDAPTKVTSAGSVQFGNLVEGQNVVAVELHRFGDSSETTFDFSVRVERSGSYRAVDGVINTNAPGFHNSQYDERENYAFDGSVVAKYFSNKCSDGADMVYLEWKYNNNRRDYINSVTWYRNTDNNRIVTYLDVRGSNNGIDWDLLVSKDNIEFGDYNTPTGRVTLDFYSPKIYNAYRVYMFNPSCNQGYEVGELVLSAKKLENFCTPDYGFSYAANGQVAQRPCNDYYNGTVYRTCTNGQWETPIEQCTLSKPLTLLYDATHYIWVTGKMNYINAPVIRAAEASLTLQTKLPDGIGFDSLTGAISGIPTVDLNNTKITIRTENAAGYIDTDITISSFPATGLSGGIIALIVIAAIIIVVAIAFIIFCISIRTKKSKKSHKKLEQKTVSKPKPAAEGAKVVKV